MGYEGYVVHAYVGFEFQTVHAWFSIITEHSSVYSISDLYTGPPLWKQTSLCMGILSNIAGCPARGGQPHGISLEALNPLIPSPETLNPWLKGLGCRAQSVRTSSGGTRTLE